VLHDNLPYAAEPGNFDGAALQNVAELFCLSTQEEFFISVSRKSLPKMRHFSQRLLASNSPTARSPGRRGCREQSNFP
jgi:hypothetical protein